MQRISCLGFTIIVLACLSPVRGAQKNATDLSAFQGNHFGKAVVTAEGDKFRGRGRINGNIAEDGLSGSFSLKGSVRVDGERVPIDNRFVLRGSGKVGVRELAPGVSDAKAEGVYSAQPRSITFQGKFDVGTVEGTFECTARVSVKRILRLTYSVTIGDDTSPSFVYSFVVKPKKR